MNLILADSAQFVMSIMRDERRRSVLTWFERLKNWEKDKYVRSHSHKLEGDDNVYMLKTNANFVIFFRLEQRDIVVLDIGNKETLRMFAEQAERGRS